MTHLPHQLNSAIENIYHPAGLHITQAPQREIESSEYDACRFGLNNQNIVFRVAKTTPTKIGQFVTLWKRPSPASEIAPLDVNDNISHVVVTVFDENHRGQFVFNQDILSKKGVMSRAGIGGKRAIRVYPPWTQPIAKQAIKTQQWQLQYFLPIQSDVTADCQLVSRLFSMGF
jgi:hypothetical protein